MDKNVMKKAIIDFLANDEKWHRFDATLSIGILDDTDWQEIAHSCGKNLYLDGGMVYTEEGVKMFKRFDC